MSTFTDSPNETSVDNQDEKHIVDDVMDEERNTKPDANDYSRFKDVDDSSSDDTNFDTSSEANVRAISECILEAAAHKDAGNLAFKKSDFRDAKARYDLGILALKPHKDKKPPSVNDSYYDEMNALLVSLYGNMAMVQIKEEDWSEAIKSASEVIKIEPDNIKALYRRGLGYFRKGHLDESKADLTKTVELDPSNVQAKKELVEVTKALKELAKKEKAAFSSMFNKTSMYDDKEKEREEKKRKEEKEREKQVDEWTKSKLARREQGLEEQTFEQWKEEKDKAKKAAEDAKIEEEKRMKKERSKNKENKPKPSKASTNDDEYDEEESKIISETKKKGYCYFNTKPSEEVKSLIGDISPKTVHKGLEPSVGTPTPTAFDSATSAVAASSWNHAGTWEERDLTKAAHDRFTALCLEAQVTDVPIPVPSAAGVAVSAKVTKVDKVEGDAQIVLARNKKKHIFDLTAKLEFEVTVGSSPTADDAAPSDEKPLKTKTFTGAIDYADITPSSSVRGVVSFKKSVPTAYQTSVETALEHLQGKVQEQFSKFEFEFKSF